MHAHKRLAQLEAAAARVADAPQLIHTVVVNLGAERFQEHRPGPRYEGPLLCLLDGCTVSQETLCAASGVHNAHEH